MEKRDTINFIFLFLCILLLGFVYLNSRMVDETYHQKQAVHTQQQSVPVKR